MEQKFFHYTKWECWQNGMYSTSKDNFKYLVLKSVNLLSDEEKLFEIMKKVSSEWVNSTAENFTNKNVNPRPWLGRAACCYNHKATEDHVRVAWMSLTKTKMDAANKVADIVIREWIQFNTTGWIQDEMF